MSTLPSQLEPGLLQYLQQLHPLTSSNAVGFFAQLNTSSSRTYAWRWNPPAQRRQLHIRQKQISMKEFCSVIRHGHLPPTAFSWQMISIWEMQVSFPWQRHDGHEWRGDRSQSARSGLLNCESVEKGWGKCRVWFALVCLQTVDGVSCLCAVANAVGMKSIV